MIAAGALGGALGRRARVATSLQRGHLLARGARARGAVARAVSRRACRGLSQGRDARTVGGDNRVFPSGRDARGAAHDSSGPQVPLRLAGLVRRSATPVATGRDGGDVRFGPRAAVGDGLAYAASFRAERVHRGGEDDIPSRQLGLRHRARAAHALHARDARVGQRTWRRQRCTGSWALRLCCGCGSSRARGSGPPRATSRRRSCTAPRW